jgi:hypothetical protein
MNNMPSRLTLLVGHALIGLLYAGLLLSAWRTDPAIAAENRLMENLQAASLFLALALSLVNLAPLRRKPPPYVAASLAVFFLTLFLREVELAGLDLPAILISLGSGGGKKALLGLLWAAVLFGAVKNRHRLKQDILTFMQHPLMSYLLAAAVFYLIGDALDKKLLPLAKPQRLFWEETAECLAALWCALGTAAWTIGNSRRLPADSNTK